MYCNTCKNWFNRMVGWPGTDCPKCQDIFNKKIAQAGKGLGREGGVLIPISPVKEGP